MIQQMQLQQWLELRTLKPLHAVTMASITNFIGPFIFGTAVAATVGKGIDSARICNY